MLKYVCCLTIILFLLPLPLYSFDKADEHAMVAYLAFSINKDYVKAIQEYSQAIKLQPNREKYYLERANIHIYIMNYEPAVNDLTQAIRLVPDSYDALLKRGDVLLKMDKPVDALSDFNAAIKLLKPQVNPRLSKQYLLHRKKSLFKMYKHYKSIDPIYPSEIDQSIGYLTAYEQYEYEQTEKMYSHNLKYCEALTFRGMTLEILEQNKQALQDYNEVISLIPHNLNAYVLRCALYARMKDYPNALVDCAQILSIDPSRIETLLLRGRIYAQLNEHAHAIDYFSEAISLDPQLLEAFLMRGLSNIALNKYREAIEDFSRTIEIDPDVVDAYYMTAVAYHKLQDSHNAIAGFTRVLDLNPSHYEALLNRGLLYNSLRDNHAISDFEHLLVLRNGDGTAQIYNELAIAYMYDAQVEEAIKSFKKAIALSPQDAQIYSVFGLCYYRQGEFDWALELLNTAIRLDSANCTPYFYRALVYREQKKYADALNDLNYIISTSKSEAYKAYLHKGIVYETLGDVSRAQENYNDCIANPYLNKHPDDIAFVRNRITFLKNKNILDNDAIINKAEQNNSIED
ncbi:MAG: tetratricopeptide repeat protein [bacterium]|nr:tetratricopeptide repeat protein [bacterium]